MRAGGPLNARIEAHNQRVGRTRAWAVACVGTKVVRYWTGDASQGMDGWSRQESAAKLWVQQRGAARCMVAMTNFTWLRLVRVEQCPGSGFPTSMGQ